MSDRKRGRKTKYTPERVQIICDAIARSGNDDAGFRSGGITESTFYKWMETFAEFSERVIAAREQYRSSCPEVLVAGCNRVIADYLAGTATRTTLTKRTRTYPNKPDMDFEEITETITKLNVPPWVLDRVLGPAMDETQAIRVLVRAGYFPDELLELMGGQFSELRSRIKNIFTDRIPDLQRHRSAGITEETAAAIRREILGDFSQGVPSLPSEMDAGQEPD